MTKIKKAVVAVAGSGTRFLPATKALPKEMLPIVDKPIIQLVVEELVEAGIEDIILVTKWDKKPLEDHFDNNWALDHELEKSGKLELKERVKKIADMANFIYVRQKGPYGNGTPILSAASIIGDEPFVFCYGDDLVKSKISFTKQMVDVFRETGSLMVGVQEVSEEDTHKYGIMKFKGTTMQLDDFIEKPAQGKAPSRFAAFGRFILNQDIVNILKSIPLGKGNELWLTDAIQKYIKDGGIVYAHPVKDGEWLTTGDPLNYMIAALKYADSREDISRDLRRFIKNYFK